MPSWSVVIVFAVLASCAAVVIAGYFRSNRKAQEASARPAAAPAGPPPVQARPVPPERGENPEPHTENWLWG